MPFSLDPQPQEDEIECGNCGALIYYGLTRCTECGINLYEPEADAEGEAEDGLWDDSLPRRGFLTRLVDLFRELTGRPFSAEEVFGDSLDQATLYGELLRKVGGDPEVVERLIQFERKQTPDGSRFQWIQNAIRRWDRDNRGPPSLRY
jgi:hypothetical protein